MNLLKKLSFVFLLFFLFFASIFIAKAQIGQYGLIKGRVLDDKGRTIKALGENYSAKIFAFNESGIYEGIINSDGGFAIKDVPSGEWFLGLDLRDNSGYLKPKINNSVRVGLGGEVSQDIVLKPADGIIAGRIIDSLGDNPKTAIDLIDANTGDIISKVSDGGGFFRFFTNSGSKILNVFGTSLNNSSTNSNSNLDLKKSQLIDIGLILPVDSDVKTISGNVIPSGEATIYAYSESGSRIVPKKSDKSGSYSISLKKGIWHVKAIRNSGQTSLESDEAILNVSDSNLTQDLQLKNSFKNAKEKSINFYSSNSVSLALDDGMSLFIPEKSLPEGIYNLKIYSTRGLSSFAFDTDVNVYNVEILSERTGEKINNLLRKAVLKIPYIKGRALSKNLELFYWNPDISGWQNSKDAISAEKDGYLISLTNYLAGFCVGCGGAGGGGTGGGGTPGGQTSGGGGTTSGVGAVSRTQVGNRSNVYIDIASASLSNDGKPQVSIRLIDSLNRIGVSTYDDASQKYIVLTAPVYTVERCSSPDSSSSCVFKTFTNSNPLSSIVTYLDRENLSSASSYYYRFSSRDEGGSSATSSFIGILTSEAPLSIISSSVNVNNNSVFLDFTTSKATKSTLYYENKTVATDSNFKTVTSYNLSDILKSSNLKDGQLYSVKIRVVAEDENDFIEQSVTFRWPKLIQSIESQPTQSNVSAPSNVIKNSGFQFTSLLKLTDNGEAVSRLQEVLVSAGYLSASLPRGYFGKRTEDALKAFQVANGLTPVGTAGPKTRALLNALLNK